MPLPMVTAPTVEELAEVAEEIVAKPVMPSPVVAISSTFAPFAAMMDQIGRERGWPPMSRRDFDQSLTLRGANFVGSPQEVIEKILFQHEIFGHQRFLLYLSSLDHAKTMRAIELYGTDVAPAVRAEVARRSGTPTTMIAS